ncbi:hypothetical protein [Amycolatopsis albispora]|uniref:Secreted protein n=1 Tax=Amycolatopsis albispora TaxID=1804986 RepID=A0A344L1B4_9PSEU|nr:hypothetical protein [Amycolatopsis albispora]AXB41838.1 hypothetical protein A4R43_04260 [Amycolatopsis albispora]
MKAQIGSLAGAAIVLAACGTFGTASAGTVPVVCGPVEVGEGRVHTLIAMPSPSGVVACSRAYRVMAEYAAVPPGERTGPVGLSDLWTCVADPGGNPVVRCVRGAAGVDHGQWFETRPPDVP